jgi:hypothetical protein
MTLTKNTIAMAIAIVVFSTNCIAENAIPAVPTAPVAPATTPSAPSGPFGKTSTSTTSAPPQATPKPVAQAPAEPAAHQAPTAPTMPVSSQTVPTQPAVIHQTHKTIPVVVALVSHAIPAAACKGFGPQTPRDIDHKAGHNKRIFSATPNYKEMNLCNIHFHNNAEHKAKAFSIYAGAGEGHGDHGGKGGGYQCQISKSLTPAELTPPQTEVCKGVKPGDTIEVHWVHSSCEVTPGKGLGSCSSKSCVNPDLRVETQVFTVVNDASATNFNDLTYQGNIVNGLHQAKSLPTNTGEPVVFSGSTTGPKYTQHACSPVQVTWSVRPACGKVDINSLGKWCEGNVFKEDHAHGVRKLVTNPALLSEIK